jgi:Arm DNA-binding domain
MMARLTALTIQNLRPTSRRREIPDGNGLYAVVQPSGRKSFDVRYRYDGKTHKLTLPRGLTLAEARVKTTKIKHEIDRGHNPADIERRRRRVSLLDHIAAKARLFLDQDQEPECYLYRHYDPGGDLLYVGISLEPLRRQKRHSERAAWRDMIFQIVIEPFAAREEALAAEQLAIRTEFPRFNDVHNGHAAFVCPNCEELHFIDAEQAKRLWAQAIGGAEGVSPPHQTMQ